MSTHTNSLAAFYDGQLEAFPRRTQDILLALMALGKATDRQVQQFLGLAERSYVQPRISEAIKSGLLVEAGTAKCAVTGHRVRLVAIAANPRAVQQELFA